MALNADLQILTQPGATGNVTLSLPSNFDPKAIIAWGVPLAADGSAASWAFSFGFGVYRASQAFQRCAGMRSLDAAATADTARTLSGSSILQLMTQGAGLGTIDAQLELVSMQTGATSQVVLNWSNLHTTASIRVFVLILGGSDITDAMVGDFTCPTAASFVDETVASGFGAPDLLFFTSNASTGIGNAAANGTLSMGFAKAGEPGRGWCFAQTDGNTASITGTRQRSDRCVLATQQPTSDDSTGQLQDPALGLWPTDGFRVVFDANPTQAMLVGYLALKTTAQITTGNSLAPTSGGLPVVQDNNAGFVPKAGFLFGWNLGASTVRQEIQADQCGFGIGATDGTTEAWAGFTEDDAATTMDSNQQQSTAKVIRNYNQAAALQSEADGSFSGNNFRLSWNDTDIVGREYQWVALGDAPAGGTDATVVATPAAATAASAAPVPALTVAAPARNATAASTSPVPAFKVATGAASATASSTSPLPTLVVAIGAFAATASSIAPAVGSVRLVVAVSATATASSVSPLPALAAVAVAAAATASSASPSQSLSVTVAVSSATASSTPPLPTLRILPGAATSTAASTPPVPALSVAAPAGTSTGSSASPGVFKGTIVVAPPRNATASSSAPLPALTVQTGAGAATASSAATVELRVAAVVGAATASRVAPLPTFSILAGAASSTASSSPPQPRLSVPVTFGAATAASVAPTISTAVSATTIVALVGAATASATPPGLAFAIAAPASMSTASRGAPVPALTVAAPPRTATASRVAPVIIRIFSNTRVAPAAFAVASSPYIPPRIIKIRELFLVPHPPELGLVLIENFPPG